MSALTCYTVFCSAYIRYNNKMKHDPDNWNYCSWFDMHSLSVKTVDTHKQIEPTFEAERTTAI